MRRSVVPSRFWSVRETMRLMRSVFLYGFKFNPTPLSNARFQVCVLVSHARKFQEDTDPNELERAARLSAEPSVVAATKKEFPERQKLGAHRWN